MDTFRACFECGSPADHQHHVIPASLGGTKTVPLCELHHGQIHSTKFLNHRELTRSGIVRAISRGSRFGRPRYGWRVVGGELAEVPEEQAAIKLVQSLRREGRTYIDIASEMSLRGVGGRKWHATQVARILSPNEQSNCQRIQ